MQCWHMSGAGNDFMVIDARGLTLDFETLSKELCARAGADGFMAVDHSEKADFKLHFYNSDGSRGEMCGNGSRCICRFAFDHDIAGENMVVETDAGLVSGKRLSESQYLVKLNNPGIVDLNRKGTIAYIELGTPGVPHAVAELPGLNWEMAEDLREQGKALRYDPTFPKGANVNFFTWIGKDTVRVMTYERGVEDYTLACGTGCGSTAVTLWLRGQLPGGRLTAENKGGTLTLNVEGGNGVVSALYLEGPTEILKEYDI